MKRKTLLALAMACVLSLVLGCSSSDPVEEIVELDDGTTDQMFDMDVYDAELYVFQIDGQALTIDEGYPVDIWGEKPLEDGGFYRVVADVTFLNGGVAGYVDYPEVHEVKSVEEIDPSQLDVPSIEDQPYGLVSIGDYAQGDLLYNTWNIMAVWEDGSWIWRYDSDIELDDGTAVLVREGITEADVQASRESGVLSCEDYFILPSE